MLSLLSFPRLIKVREGDMLKILVFCWIVMPFLFIVLAAGFWRPGSWLSICYPGVIDPSLLLRLTNWFPRLP